MAFALVVGACSPVVTPPVGTTPATKSLAASLPPPSAPEPEPPAPTAIIVADCGRVVAATEPHFAPKQGLAVYSTPVGLTLYSITDDSTAILDSGTSPGG